MTEEQNQVAAAVGAGAPPSEQEVEAVVTRTLNYLKTETTKAVRFDAKQELNPSQQAVVRSSLNVPSIEEMNNAVSTGGVKDAVRYGKQALEDPQKEQARKNIDVPSTEEVSNAIANADGVVRYDKGQSLGGAQKEQARKNIGCNFKASTADLQAGTSALATGELYFVYE